MQHHVQRLHTWLERWTEEAGRVVIDPAAFFTEHDHSYRHAVRFAVTAGIITAVLQVVALTILTSLHILAPPPHITALPDAVVPRLLTGIGAAVGSGLVAGTVGVALLGGVLHAAVRLLGGTGLERTVSVVGHAAAVSAVFGWLLSVTSVGAVITALYWGWVTMQGIATVHDFSRLRALFAILLPVITAGLLAAAAVGVAALQFLSLL